MILYTEECDFSFPAWENQMQSSEKKRMEIQKLYQQRLKDVEVSSDISSVMRYIIWDNLMMEHRFLPPD